MSKDKKPTTFDLFNDDSLWGNKETDSLSHEELLDTKWNRKRTKAEKLNSKIKSREAYNHGKYILRSPGNDLLDFYDSIMLQLEPTSKASSHIPPSVVYHYRYDHDYPKYIFNKSLNYGKHSYLRDSLQNYYKTNDGTYWAQLKELRFKWLVNKPHDKWEFDTQTDLKQFARDNLGITLPRSINVCNKITQGNDRSVNFYSMCWRGAGAGYSIEFVPHDLNDDYWKDIDIVKLEKYSHHKIINPSDNPKLQKAIHLGVKIEDLASLKAIHTHEGEFVTIKFVAEHFNVDNSTIYHRINSKSEQFKEWYYVDPKPSADDILDMIKKRQGVDDPENH